jgi:hypothetical protein
MNANGRKDYFPIEGERKTRREEEENLNFKALLRPQPYRRPL